MKKKILILLAIFMVSIYPAVAATLTGAQGSPATIQVRYTITSDTSFSIATQTDNMEFAGTREAKLVYPTGQVLPDTPWAIITNSGTVTQTFKASLNATDPGIQLYISNASTFTGKILVSTSAQSPVGWSSVPAAGTRNLFAYANFSLAPEGLTVENLTIET